MSMGESVIWAELFANIPPTSGSPNPPAGIPSVRYDHAAVVANKNLFITHGYKYHHHDKDVGSDYRKDTWRFNIDKKEWYELDSGDIFPAERNSLSSVLYHDRQQGETSMCIFGGDDGGKRQGGAGYQHGSFFNDVWCSVILNGETPVTAMDWQRKGPKEGLADSIPQITSHHSAVEYNGGMYVYGGITVNADLPTGGERVDTSSLWRFDLANDTWSKFPSVTSASPPPRHSHTAVVHEDRMYVYGGSDLKKVHFNDMWTFDFNTQVWENITTDAFPSARSWHGAGVAEGDMYVFGGGQCEKSCKLHNELWKYTFSSQTWTQLDVGSAPLGRYKHTFTVMEQRGGEGGVNIILTGGESYRPYQYYNDVWQLHYGTVVYLKRGVLQGFLMTYTVFFVFLLILYYSYYGFSDSSPKKPSTKDTEGKKTKKNT